MIIYIFHDFTLCNLILHILYTVYFSILDLSMPKSKLMKLRRIWQIYQMDKLE